MTYTSRNKDTEMKFKTSIFAIVTVVLLAAATRGDDEELKLLQGRFERTFKNQAGTAFRVEKFVTGNKSSVTTYDDAGSVVESHTSTFKIEKQGAVRVFSF